MSAVLSVPNFPFFIGTIDPKVGGDVPEPMTFELNIEPQFGLIRQTVDAAKRDALARVYSLGSMLSTPLGRSELARDRFRAVLDQLTLLLPDGVRGKSMLEVGCGEGDVLNELKIMGAKVSGIEIGPQGRRAAERWRIEIYADPLEECDLPGQLDCIYSLGCLEHIEDLAPFLAACRRHLRPGGLVFHSVPNFASAMKTLRKEDLAHQHINYFTPASATRLLQIEGYTDIGVASNVAGNELFMWGRYSGRQAPAKAAAQDIHAATVELSDFARRLSDSWDAERRFFDATAGAGRSVGIYAGGFISAVVLGQQEYLSFYDGDSSKYGQCWLKGLSPIRDPRTLTANPVDHLVISTVHHYGAITKFLIDIARIPDSIRLHCGFDSVTCN